MGTPTRLDDAKVAELLDTLSGWTRDGGEITKQFTFGSFADAVAFIDRVAPTCDELNHHPTWCNTYNRIDVRLSTHDVDGLSGLDFELAGRMDALA